ncbi:hypothetical protein DFJ74DRAFT_683190 [Hyaloraphidium curvatum]|nr:hypothetical protein DFJ74DRAFT_683190 [Hyaloraphidium curvatum]
MPTMHCPPFSGLLDLPDEVLLLLSETFGALRLRASLLRLLLASRRLWRVSEPALHRCLEITPSNLDSAKTYLRDLPRDSETRPRELVLSRGIWNALSRPFAPEDATGLAALEFLVYSSSRLSRVEKAVLVDRTEGALALWIAAGRFPKVEAVRPTAMGMYCALLGCKCSALVMTDPGAVPSSTFESMTANVREAVAREMPERRILIQGIVAESEVELERQLVFWSEFSNVQVGVGCCRKTEYLAEIGQAA